MRGSPKEKGSRDHSGIAALRKLRVLLISGGYFAQLSMRLVAELYAVVICSQRITCFYLGCSMPCDFRNRPRSSAHQYSQVQALASDLESVYPHLGGCSRRVTCRQDSQRQRNASPRAVDSSPKLDEEVA